MSMRSPVSVGGSVVVVFVVSDAGGRRRVRSPAYKKLYSYYSVSIALRYVLRASARRDATRLNKLVLTYPNTHTHIYVEAYMPPTHRPTATYTFSRILREHTHTNKLYTCILPQSAHTHTHTLA